MKIMKKQEMLQKISEIKSLVKDRDTYEGEEDLDWVYHYDSVLHTIETIVADILGEVK